MDHQGTIQAQQPELSSLLDKVKDVDADKDSLVRNLGKRPGRHILPQKAKTSYTRVFLRLHTCV